MKPIYTYDTNGNYLGQTTSGFLQSQFPGKTLNVTQYIRNRSLFRGKIYLSYEKLERINPPAIVPGSELITGNWLTFKQLKLLQEIRTAKIPPSIQELTDAMGVSSTNSIRKLLAALEHKGYITISGNARGIRRTGKEPPNASGKTNR